MLFCCRIKAPRTGMGSSGQDRTRMNGEKGVVTYLSETRMRFGNHLDRVDKEEKGSQDLFA